MVGSSVLIYRSRICFPDLDWKLFAINDQFDWCLWTRFINKLSSCWVHCFFLLHGLNRLYLWEHCESVLPGKYFAIFFQCLPSYIVTIFSSFLSSHFFQILPLFCCFFMTSIFILRILCLNSWESLLLVVLDLDSSIISDICYCLV